MDIVESTDRGGGVRLYLPVVETAAKDGELRVEGRTGQTVLVVDDDREFLDMTRRALRRAGYDVVCATSGEEGVAVLESNSRITVAVVDAMMPAPGGQHLCAVVRRVQPDACLVMTSGFSRDYIQSLVPGANWRFLQKPADENLLLQTLGGVLRVESETVRATA